MIFEVSVLNTERAKWPSGQVYSGVGALIITITLLAGAQRFESNLLFLLALLVLFFCISTIPDR